MILTVCNQKGGTGKTTTAAALAQASIYRGHKTLVVDLDPQCNLTYIMGGNPLDIGAFELLTGKSEFIQKTANGDIIAGSLNLAAADTLLAGEKRIYALQNGLAPLKKTYDVIVIDTAPTLGTLLINALTAADKVIIPLHADILSLQGLFQLSQTINKVKTDYNPALRFGGIVYTQHSGRTLVSREITKTIEARAAELHIPVLKTAVRDGVAVKEAQMMRKSLFEYAPKSKPAADYLNLIKELGL